MRFLVRVLAALLLVLTSALLMLKGTGVFLLGFYGADYLVGTVAPVIERAGEYAGLMRTQLESAIAAVLATESRLDPVVAAIADRGGTFRHLLVAAGGLIFLCGLLAFVAAVKLVIGSPGNMIHVGCATAIVADAAPMALLGFHYAQLPGIVVGLIGMASARFAFSVMRVKPVVQPVIAKPRAPKTPPGERPAATTRTRDSVKTAEFQKPKFGFAFRLPRIRLPRFKLPGFKFPRIKLPRMKKSVKQPVEKPVQKPAKKPGGFKLPKQLIAVTAGVIVLIGGAGVAFFAYQKYFAQDFAQTPRTTTASPPAPVESPLPLGGTIPGREAPPPPPPPPDALIPSTPVNGQLAGQPFKPERVAVKLTTWWKLADGRVTVASGTGQGESFEKLSLVLDAGSDRIIEITDLPENYDLKRGLKLSVKEGETSPDQPKLKLTMPQGAGELPKIDFIYDDYELELILNRLRGNRISGKILLALPDRKETEVAGTFKAWVDGHPEIEPDLARGGGQTFRFLAYQYLKDLYPGSRVTIKDQTYSHEVGDASRELLTGHIMVVFTVNGQENASILRVSTSEGYWRVLDSLEATYLAEAHPLEFPDPKNEGRWVNYLAAKHTEEWFREKHPGKYPWSVRLTGTSNTDIGYADIHLSLKPYGEAEEIKRRYYFLRKDGRWRYIRDLKEEEQIDSTTGKVRRTPKTS